MTAMTLYGTVTSPYVRRVRIVALELGIDSELVDTFTPEGQTALRELSPIWKVPAARIDGVDLYDSAVITQYLLRHHGPGGMAPWDDDDIPTRNLVTVTDGALDALINVFYLAKDGVAPEQASYVAKQAARAKSAMTWLDARIPPAWLQPDTPLSLPLVALYTAIDWMRFRQTYDVAAHPTIAELAQAQAQRDPLRATAPPA